MEDVLIFVDGELYTGEIIYCPYKGFGWPESRAAGIRLDKNLVKPSQKVSILNLKYNKLRDCIYNSENQTIFLDKNQIYWDVIDMPQDLC